LTHLMTMLSTPAPSTAKLSDQQPGKEGSGAPSDPAGGKPRPQN
jgi:hypothetical protein